MSEMNEINLPKGDLTEGDLTPAELKQVLIIWREKLQELDALAYAYAKVYTKAYANALAYAYAYDYANNYADAYANNYANAVEKINQFWLESVGEIRNARN